MRVEEEVWVLKREVEELKRDLSALKRANCVFINGKKNINYEKKILEKNEKIKIFYTKYKAENIDN